MAKVAAVLTALPRSPEPVIPFPLVVCGLSASDGTDGITQQEPSTKGTLHEPVHRSRADRPERHREGQ